MADQNFSRDPAFRTAQLGIEVDRFISEYDKIGNYLMAHAKQCRTDALEKLAVIDPTNSLAIMQLQMNAEIPDLFVAWLGEALLAGKAAEAVIDAEESYEG